MPDTVSLQNLLDLAIPLVVAGLSYLFQMTHWSAKRNMIIATIAVFVAAIAEAFVQHKITGNAYSDFMLIAEIAAALQIGAFAPLAQWLKSIGSKPPTTAHVPAVASSSVPPRSGAYQYPPEH